MKRALPASDWERIQRLFFEAADLPLHEQDRFLERACADDRRLRSEVESLLRTDLAGAHDFDAIVSGVAQNMVGADPLVGTRFGPWRVVSELGRGGMGVVYLAVRDDDQFRKQVALKLVKYGMDTAEQWGRFRHERQILASLDHPYIARLIDGGSGPSGQPFLAMEYVAGDRIDAWCQVRELSIAARCRLMLKVCEAVSYAHRNLVVHRDLKPGNILITADGAPKLLDFGVAKLLDPDTNPAAAATTVLQRALTPEYASPEQVLGQPVTTATDVYSLGAILYELLSGKRAHRVHSVTPAEVERAVCQTAIQRPSEVLDRSLPNFTRLRREISGDLDNIVLMAMRKEAERRYSSVEQLAEDLRRFLDGHPVAARQDSLGYRVGKFVRRRRVEVTAALLVLASLVAGMVLAASEWRQAVTARRAADAQRVVAERERASAETARQSEAAQHRIADEQRDAAVLERGRAEQRLTQMLMLADKTLFDVHDAINTLPGAVTARQKLVGITLEYLERLEKDGLNDRLRSMLGAAYYKVGQILGEPDHPSLQDAASAERSFRKAEALLAPLYAQKPNDPDAMMQWLDVEASLAEAAVQSANPEKGRDLYLKLLPLAHRVSQLPGIGEITAHEESRIYSRLSYVEGNRLGHSDAGLQYANRSVELLTALIPRFPNDFGLKASLAAMNASVAQKLNQLGRLEEAATAFEAVIRAREDLLVEHPNDVDLRSNLLICYGNYAALLGMPWSANLGRLAEARVYAGKSVTLARDLAKLDPQDSTAQLNLSLAMAHTAMIDPEPGKVEESLRALEEALAILEPIVKGSPKSAPLVGYLGLNREFIARRLWSLNRRAEAEAMFRRSMDAAAGFRAPDGGYSLATSQDMRSLEALARFYAEAGDRERTVQAADQALTAAKNYLTVEPTSERRLSALANAYFERASAFRALGDWDKARPEAEQAVTIWHGIHDPNAAAQYRGNIPLAEAILREASSHTPR
jgi:tetratricopeptide (TPR) repeat protein